MKLFYGSIRKKLYLLVLLAIIPVFIVLFTTGLINRKETLLHAEHDVLQELDSLAELQQRITDSTRTLLRTVVSFPGIINLDFKQSSVLLEAIIDANPMFTNIILVDLQGDVITSGTEFEQTKVLNFSDRLQFIDAIESNGFATGEYVIGKQSKKAIFTYGIAVPGLEGQPIGAIIVGVDLGSYLNHFENLSNYNDSFFGLSDHKGIRTFRFPISDSTNLGEPIKSEVFQAAIENKKGSIITKTSDNKTFIIAYTCLSLEKCDRPYMYIFVGHNYAEIERRSVSMLIWIIASSILSLILALTISKYSGQKIIATQIESLSKAAEKFSRGESEISTVIDYEDGELGHLASSFDLMVETIHKRDEEKDSLVLQLNQSQKMDAIGKLAGGIAHDFNNLLSGIIGSTELLGLRLQDDEKAKKYQEIIMVSAQRAADLAGKLLAFSRTSGKVSKDVDLHSIIGDTLQILRNTIDRRIVINTDLNAISTNVLGDPSLFQSALLNLCINSSHAIQTKGSIEIVTEDINVDDLECKLSGFDLEPGPFISIEVRDNGSGISKENVDKVFEPFFTTKKQGEGTGLGLPAVYSTIQKYGGSITLQSEENVGTVFRIILPIVEKKISEEPEKIGEYKKRSGTILIVDDEEVLRITAEMILKELGYETFSVGNGIDAINFIKSNEHKVDLVLLDMIMPEMNGKDCFFELKKIAPNLEVLLCTGLTNNDDLQEMIDNGLKSYLQKPYQIIELDKAVAGLLE